MICLDNAIPGPERSAVCSPALSALSQPSAYHHTPPPTAFPAVSADTHTQTHTAQQETSTIDFIRSNSHVDDEASKAGIKA